MSGGLLAEAQSIAIEIPNCEVTHSIRIFLGWGLYIRAPSFNLSPIRIHPSTKKDRPDHCPAQSRLDEYSRQGATGSRPFSILRNLRTESPQQNLARRRNSELIDRGREHYERDTPFEITPGSKEQRNEGRVKYSGPQRLSGNDESTGITARQQPSRLL